MQQQHTIFVIFCMFKISKTKSFTFVLEPCIRFEHYSWDTLDYGNEGTTQAPSAAECAFRCKLLPTCIGSSWWGHGSDVSCHVADGGTLVEDLGVYSYYCGDSKQFFCHFFLPCAFQVNSSYIYPISDNEILFLTLT